MESYSVVFLSRALRFNSISLAKFAVISVLLRVISAISFKLFAVSLI
jgi:hypothetical protein